MADPYPEIVDVFHENDPDSDEACSAIQGILVEHPIYQTWNYIGSSAGALIAEAFLGFDDNLPVHPKSPYGRKMAAIISGVAFAVIERMKIEGTLTEEQADEWELKIRERKRFRACPECGSKMPYRYWWCQECSDKFLAETRDERAKEKGLTPETDSLES